MGHTDPARPLSRGPTPGQGAACLRSACAATGAGAILRLGPDDPDALRWLWEHWGTTWSLRRVEMVHYAAEHFAVRFCSADWPPWLVLRQIQSQWPELTLTVKVEYG
ncbi:MAG TPA: hypothetical protein VE690_06575 [Rhodopila sp.]|nr:hypothetical protein [Rhodopila sp.]